MDVLNYQEKVANPRQKTDDEKESDVRIRHTKVLNPSVQCRFTASQT